MCKTNCPTASAQPKSCGSCKTAAVNTIQLPVGKNSGINGRSTAGAALGPNSQRAALPKPVDEDWPVAQAQDPQDISWKYP